MGDTITLNTRILLAMKDFHDETMAHGGSSRARMLERIKMKGVWSKLEIFQ
jgi:hypothetical protein